MTAAFEVQAAPSGFEGESSEFLYVKEGHKIEVLKEFGDSEWVLARVCGNHREGLLPMCALRWSAADMLRAAILEVAPSASLPPARNQIGG
jgi:hypothetical protein